MSGSFVQGLLFPSPVHKWRVVCAVVLLLVSLGGGARSEPFLVDDGGMLLPLRFVVQSLGGQVDMLPFHGIKSVNVTLDERTARVDYLPTNEYKRAAHTTKFCLTLDGNVGYVPLEFFPEELGVRPIFDAKRNRIVIDHPSTGRGLTLFGDSGLPDEAVIKQFFQAIRNGNDRKVGSLLGKYPALVNGREWGLTPLHVAALHGRLDAGRLLLLGQANPNAPTTGSHLTPMHYAARSGNVEMLRQLLQLGGRVNTCYRDRAGSGTPLDEAVGAGHCEAALLLMDKGAAIRGHVLTRAVCRNDRGIVSAALEHGWNIDSECAPPPFIGTLLHFTVFRHTMDHDKLEMLRFLLERGANVNSTNSKGRTPLFIAVANGHADAAEVLILNGADTHVKDKSGQTPLDVATPLVAEWLREYCNSSGGE